MANKQELKAHLQDGNKARIYNEKKKENIKKYIVTIKTTQQWFKTIEVKENEKPKEVAEDNFHETHYRNYDGSWENPLLTNEEYKVIELEKVI